MKSFFALFAIAIASSGVMANRRCVVLSSSQNQTLSAETDLVLVAL